MVRWSISVSTTNGKPLRFLVSTTVHKSYPRDRIVASNPYPTSWLHLIRDQFARSMY